MPRQVSEDDLLRAIERLAALGSGFGVVRIGTRQFVRSVPTELSTDSNEVIELAQVCVRVGAWVGREGVTDCEGRRGESGRREGSCAATGLLDFSGRWRGAEGVRTSWGRRNPGAGAGYRPQRSWCVACHLAPT